MLNKNDPLIGAVQEVMKRNQTEREAVKLVNEKFGVTDRKALPHEKQGAWDAAYKQVLSEGLHPNQQKLDVHEPEKDKLTKHDFKMLRAKKKSVEEDVTSPSSMGIKKPDYAPAGTTPDYAKPKEQTVNRAAKTSLPAGTMKEEKASEAQKAKIAKVMSKWKKGKEHIGKSEKTVPVTKKGQKQAVAIALSQAGLSKKKVNEGFNNRHDLSVTASAEEQVVTDQLNEKAGLPLAARQAQQQASKNRAMTNARLAREPKEAPSSFGTRIKQGLGAVDAGVRRFSQGLGGDYVAAAGDYAVKNIGAAVGLGKGTTYSKELEQEKEKSRRAELNYPTATKIGDAADTASTVAGVAGLGKGAVKYGIKKFAASKVDDVAQAAPKLLSAPKTAKPVSQAAREPTAVDKFIAKAKQTPVTPAAREGGTTATAAGTQAAANAAKYNKSGTAGGRFSDRLAQARQNAGSDPKARQLPALRGTTQPTNYVRPGVPAVRPAPSTALARPGMPNLAAGGKTRIVGLSDKAKAGIGIGLGAAAVGTAGYLMSKNNNTAPAKADAAAPTVTKPKKSEGPLGSNYADRVPQSAPSPSTAPAPAANVPVPKARPATTPAPAAPKAKPATTPAPAAPKAKPATPAAQPVRKAAPQDSSTPAQRAQFNRQVDKNGIGPSGKPTAYKGLGVTTGTTVKQKPMAPNKNLPSGK